MPFPETGHTALARLRLFQLVSSSLPIGGFTYSQGIERAVEDGWLSNAETTGDWLGTAMKDSLCYLDLPIINRLYEAVQEESPERFTEWSQYLLASRETSELRQEELQRARALGEVLDKLPHGLEADRMEPYRPGMAMSQAAGFALAGFEWQVPLYELLSGFAWSWLENAVNAAIKLVPLGQTAGQGLLYQLSTRIPDLVEMAYSVDDDELGASTPALAIASSLHETQYCRLFRS